MEEKEKKELCSARLDCMVLLPAGLPYQIAGEHALGLDSSGDMGQWVWRQTDYLFCG